MSKLVFRHLGYRLLATLKKSPTSRTIRDRSIAGWWPLLCQIPGQRCIDTMGCVWGETQSFSEFG
ncbi:MAG: hypothetical protein CMJ81_17875 [Planctomycetaceae bacterium]|nr:hypothetical protein [Planctomycetaceae bacterium]